MHIYIYIYIYKCTYIYLGIHSHLTGRMNLPAKKGVACQVLGSA